MADVLLTRRETSDQGTFGRLDARGLTLFAGELPWRDNQRGISCIPVGTYRVDWIYAGAWRGGRWVYLLHGVQGRSSILIHSGNYCGDVALGYRSHVQGCILLGERLGWIAKQKAVLLSAPAVRRFEEVMQRRPFTLEVRND